MRSLPILPVAAVLLSLTLANASAAPRPLVPEGWREVPASGQGGKRVFVSPNGVARLTLGHVPAQRGNRSREMDRRALLGMLAIAVEKGIPLGTAVRGFAAERRDRLGSKLRYLGQLSDRGVRPDVALAQAEISLPDDALVAVRTGVDSRSLAVLLKGAARSAKKKAPVK